RTGAVAPRRRTRACRGSGVPAAGRNRPRGARPPPVPGGPDLACGLHLGGTKACRKGRRTRRTYLQKRFRSSAESLSPRRGTMARKRGWIALLVVLPVGLAPVACGDGQDERAALEQEELSREDRKSTRLNSSHVKISYAVFCL